MNIGISFGGIESKGANTVPCKFCGERLHTPWVIYENDANIKVYLCHRHYRKWEDRRASYMRQLSIEFIKELGGLSYEHNPHV